MEINHYRCLKMKGCCWSLDMVAWFQLHCQGCVPTTHFSPRTVKAQVRERRVRLNNSSDNANTGCEMGFLYRLARLRLWEHLHLGSSQVRYFGHVIQMPPEILTGKVFWTCPSGGHTLERSSLSANLGKPWNSPTENGGNAWGCCPQSWPG